MKIAIVYVIILMVLSIALVFVMFQAGIEYGKTQVIDYAIQKLPKEDINALHKGMEGIYGKGYKSERVSQ